MMHIKLQKINFIHSGCGINKNDYYIHRPELMKLICCNSLITTKTTARLSWLLVSC